MKLAQRTATSVLALSVATVGLAACGGSGGAGSGDQKPVNGRTFSLAIDDDPGSLDPQAKQSVVLLQVNRFAYDTLVAVDAKGSIVPQLATSWKVEGKTLTMAIRKGVTCSDGSPFTAQTAADNINYVADPDNQSQYLGRFLPEGATASAAGTDLTVKLAEPAPFVLNGLSNVSMVCEAGMKDRSSLRTESSGTGPYVLSKATAGHEYVYTRRKGYTWGPNGAKTSQPGMPAKLVVKLIENNTTAANELIAGQVSAATIRDTTVADRLDAAGLSAKTQERMVGEQEFNHDAGHATSDPAVRMALTQALDLDKLRTVLTSGKGKKPTQLALLAPPACDGDSVSGSVPDRDVEAAEAALDGAGWKKGADGIRAKDGKQLSLKFDYLSLLGTGGSAAAELAAEQWKAIGVKVTTKVVTLTDFSALESSGDWDIFWVPFNASSPDQNVSILSGDNFSGIDNAEYDAHIAKAATQQGAKGFPDWLAGESALMKAADVVPFATSLVWTFSKNATFEFSTDIIPTSIKMLG